MLSTQRRQVRMTGWMVSGQLGLLLLHPSLGGLLEAFLAAGGCQRSGHGTFLDYPLLDADLQQIRLGGCFP